MTIDLAVTDGQPLIVRQRVGMGWVASLLSAPQDGLARGPDDALWNAMATWPSFLPLMQQLVQTVLNTGVERNNVLAGELLQGTIAESADRSQVTIVRPDGSETQISTEALDGSGTLRWLYGQTETRGIYRARTSSGQEQLYAVNIRPIESRLDSVGLAQLPKPSTSNRQLLGTTTNLTAPATTGDAAAKLLLGLLFLLLVSESVLAWSLGRRIG